MTSTNKKVSFWKIFLASLVAGIALIFLFFILFSIIASSLVNTKPVYTVKNNTVLHLTLSSPISELSKNELDFNFSGFGMANDIGLADLLYGFEKAAQDDRIKGIFVELKGAYCGYANAAEIRKAIKRFEEESGKFVIAYHSGEVTTLKQYYIASAASENYGFPSTNFEFLGLGAELMFFKGLFDKLDLEMQVIRGPNNDFKSAVEPYFLTEMSDSSRLQMEQYINGMWNEVKTRISKERNISIEDLDSIANKGIIRRVEQAADLGLLDEIKYRDGVIEIIADHVGVEDVEKLNFQSFEKYAQKKFEAQQRIANTKNADIAVVIAEGEVSVNGDGLASSKITKLLRKARKDKHIKTIIFRINSPGGSALASDEIWREVQLANQEKKVIVSMGDVAASGGYYIAAPAAKIFAQKTTITGSIGVFGVIPYTGKMLEEKLGLSFDRIQTNDHAVLSTNKKLTPEEFNIIQEEVNDIYVDFLNRVAEGRNMSIEQVNNIARGRVWTGEDALKVGLVDTIGGISDAIAYAIKDLDLENPVIRYYPKVEKEEWMEILEILNKDKEEEGIKEVTIPQEMVDLYKRIKQIENWTGIQARLPYEIIW